MRTDYCEEDVDVDMNVNCRGDMTERPDEWWLECGRRAQELVRKSVRRKERGHVHDAEGRSDPLSD